MGIVPLAIEMRIGDKNGCVMLRMPTNAESLDCDVVHMRTQQRILESDRVYRYPLYIIAEKDGMLVEYESNPTDGFFMQDLG